MEWEQGSFFWAQLFIYKWEFFFKRFFVLFPLGYLQEEGLPATSRAFIHESPNLKEYAEHTTGDGTIPACVFVSLRDHIDFPAI